MVWLYGGTKGIIGGVVGILMGRVLWLYMEKKRYSFRLRGIDTWTDYPN